MRKKLQDRIAVLLRDEFLISSRVELVEAKSLFKSKGKAQRVQDLRGEDNG